MAHTLESFVARCRGFLSADPGPAGCQNICDLLCDALKDPAFLAEAQKQKLDISPASGEELAERVERLYRTPPAVVERTQAVRKQALGLETGGPKAP